MAFDFDSSGNLITAGGGAGGFDFDADGNPLTESPADESGGFLSSAKQIVGSTIRGAGQVAADFIPGVDQDNAVKRYGQEMIEANPTAVDSFSDIADKPGTAVAEATGNAVGSMAGIVGARALGMGITAAAPLTGPAAPVTAAIGQAIAWFGPAAIAALPSFGSIRDKQILNDPAMEDSAKAKAIAALGAGTVGLIENKFGPQQWALSALTKEGRAQLAKKFAETGILKGLGYGAAKGAAVEGAEELVQNPIEQAASFEDPTTPQSLKETAFGGAMGAIGGGVLGGGTGAAVNMMPRQPSVTDVLDAPDVDSAIQTAAKVLALPAPGTNTGETILATEAGTAGTASQFDMLRRQAEIREAGGGMGRNADITDVQPKAGPIQNDPAALLDRQSGDPLAPMVEDRRIRTDAIDAVQREAEQRKAAELEAIPEIATEQNAVAAALERAGSLQTPTAMELALQRARGPSAPAAEPTPTSAPLPRVVERTPQMVALPQRLAEQRAAATGGEVVRIRNQSGKFAFTVIPKAADVSQSVDTARGVPAGMDGRSGDAGGGEPAGGLGDRGLGAATESGRGGDADVAVGGGAGAEPVATWFGRRGDGYLTEGDAAMAIPSRQRIAPDLRWRIERMPTGKFRLAGYPSAAVESQDANIPRISDGAPRDIAVSADAGRGDGGVSSESNGADVGKYAADAGVDGKDAQIPSVGSEPGSRLAGGSASKERADATANGQPADRRAADPAQVTKTPPLSGVSSAPAESAASGANKPTERERIEATRRKPAPEVSRYTGKYGKGMGHDAARLEAARLNRANDGVTYTAEEHGDPSLENPWAVVGRKAEAARSPEADERDAAAEVSRRRGEVWDGETAKNRQFYAQKGGMVLTSRQRAALGDKKWSDLTDAERKAVGKGMQSYGTISDRPADANPDQTPLFARAKKPIDQTKTAAFKAWFGKSKVVDEDGKPLRVYHGTTADFSEFDRDRGNIESDFGAGFYFTNTPADVESNYAGIGPDLENKIQLEAERIASETDREYDDPEVIAEAREQWVQHEGATMPVYLSLQNPAILGGKGETVLTMEMPYDESTDEYGEETGTLVNFVVGLRQIASRYDDGDVESAIDTILGDAGSESISLADALEILKKDEQFGYYTDENGRLASHEIIRQALERAGFDGIIDRTVDQKFGSQRRIGKSMKGMHDGTVHYIAFEPEQIKSATGNRGTFDRSKKDITFAKGEASPSGLTPSEFTAAIATAFGPRVAERLESKGIVVAVEDRTSLPDRVVSLVRENGIVYGFYDPVSDKTYAVLENLSADMVKGLVLHEVGIHYGFEQMLGKEKYGQVIARLKLMGKAGNKQVVAARDKARQNAANETQVPEETLAYLIGENTEMTLVQDVIARIKAFLFNTFGIGGKYLNANDMTALARAAVLHASKSERRADVGADTLYSRAEEISPGQEFWAKIKAGEQFTDEEIQNAYAIGQRGTERTASGMDRAEAELGAAPGQETVRWDEKIAGFDGYRTVGIATGDGSFAMGVIPEELHTGRRSVGALAETAIVTYRFTRLDDGRHQLDILDPNPGSTVFDELQRRGRLDDTGQQDEHGQPYFRAQFDKRYTTSRALLQEAVRRLALHIGEVPTLVQIGRDTGARAGSRAEREGSPQQVEAKFSRSVVTGKTNRTYTAEQKRAMRHVGFETEVPTLEERAKALWQDAGKKLAQGLVDQFAPVKELDRDAYALLRLSKGASGAFETFLRGGKLKLTEGVYDFDQTNPGGVVEKLLIPLQGEHHDFFRWVAANRAERLKAEGRENLFSDQDIRDLKTLASGTTAFDYTIQTGPQAGTVTRDRTKVYADAQRLFNEFNKNILDLAEQSGLIDPESRKLWEHEFYVPFYRVADDDDGGVRGMNIKGGMVRQQAFKQLKGGKGALNADLLDNTLMNWAHLLDAAAKNRAAKATLEAAERMGVAINAPQSTAQQIGTSTGNKSGVVWFMDGGQKRFFVVDDPFIMEAITALEYAGMRNPVMNAMGAFKHALTIGVTASPFFKIRNLIRDSVQVIATGPISFNPAKNLGQGFKLTKQGTDEYFRLLAGGGTIHFGTMLEGSEAKRVQALVESGVDDATILNSDNKVKAFYRQFIEPAITAYNELGNRGEAINRAALYDQLRRQGVGHREASLQARDLMDFSMQGSFTTIRFLTQVVPFMNARMQGLYKLGRGAKQDPARFAAVLGATSLMSLSLWAAYSDDDDWKKREEWDRNNYWWFKFGGVAFRIPKPFEIGAIATVAERGAELFFDEEMTGKRFRQQIRQILSDNLSMNPVPQLVKPILDVYSNKNSFTGRPIESMGMEKLKPEYRFNDRTSMAARALSTGMNAVTGAVGFDSPSPVQIDHMIRGYFGWLGSFVVGSADVIARPATGQAKHPTPDYWKVATGGMVASTDDAPSRYVSQMYEQAKEIEEAYGTWRALLKQGKREEAKEFFEDNKAAIVKHGRIGDMKQAQAQINERIRMIERSNMAPEAKRDRIRKLQEQKDRIARKAS